MAKLTTFTAAGGFTQGAVLGSAKLQSKFYRALAQDFADDGVTVDLADDVLVTHINAVDGNTAEAETARVSAILAAVGKVSDLDDDDADDNADDTADNEKPITPSPAEKALIQGVKVPLSISAKREEAAAQEDAAKADNDAALATHMTKIGDAVTYLSMVSIYIMEDLLRIYGREHMMGMPRVESGKIGDKPDPACNNPDFRQRPSARNGSKTMAWWQYNAVFAESLKPTRDLVAQALAVDEDNVRFPSKFAKAREKNTISQRISRQTAKTLSAIDLFHHLEDAKTYPGIRVTFDTAVVLGDDGKPVMIKDAKGRMVKKRERVETSKPIIVRAMDGDKLDDELFLAITVEQFNSLDFAKALAKGGTWESLIATMSAEDDGPKSSDRFKIKEASDVYLAFLELGTFLRGIGETKFGAWLDIEGAEQTQALKDMDNIGKIIRGHLARYRERLDDAYEMEKEAAQSKPAAA